MRPSARSDASGQMKYINCIPRLMSDYEVTLVNDNSKILSLLSMAHCLLTRGSVCGTRSPTSRTNDLYICNKGRSFTCGLRGQKRVSYSMELKIFNTVVADTLQLPSRAAFGKSTSNFLISTHTRAQASDLLIASSTQILTSCQCPRHTKRI